VDYLYLRENPAGPIEEWWYHRMGCGRWFLALRDTRTNEVARTFWPPREADSAEAVVPPQGAEP
jgi:sarcosine oxidase subunit delta